MQHNWDKYFDTESEYWEKIQKIYEENDNYPKVVVPGRNLHHKFLRSFSRLEGTEIDNDKDNLVSLSEGDHFLVHYYLWKCTKTGYRNRTALAVRFMYKKAAKYLTDEIAELIAKEWTCKGIKHSEDSKKKQSEKMKGKTPWNKGKKGIYSEEIIEKMSKAHKGKKLSEEVKAKISKIHKGRNHGPLSEETKAKISATKKGKKISTETKEKMSRIHKGKHWKLIDGKRVYY